jgi:hypothetical protein
MKKYEIKLLETIKQLNGILNNVNSESTIKLISNELFGYERICQNIEYLIMILS